MAFESRAITERFRVSSFASRRLQGMPKKYNAERHTKINCKLPTVSLCLIAAARYKFVDLEIEVNIASFLIEQVGIVTVVLLFFGVAQSILCVADFVGSVKGHPIFTVFYCVWIRLGESAGCVVVFSARREARNK